MDKNLDSTFLHMFPYVILHGMENNGWRRNMEYINIKSAQNIGVFCNGQKYTSLPINYPLHSYFCYKIKGGKQVYICILVNFFNMKAAKKFRFTHIVYR